MQRLQLHIGRVAQHDVEAAFLAFRPNLGENRAPVEGADALAPRRVLRPAVPEVRADKAIAAAQRVVERRQGRVGTGGMQPERQLGDLDGGRIEVHAIDVARQDIGRERGGVDLGLESAGQPYLLALHLDALVQEPAERRDQEGA